MKQRGSKLHATLLALFATCVLLSEVKAGGRRKLASSGDILGTYDQVQLPAEITEGVEVPRSREVADHAHYYNAAEVLTRWAEATFALTASAHKQLDLLPDMGRRSPCVYDGTRCLFNPLLVAADSFPAPELSVEKILKRFAIEAYLCRRADDRPTCHLDSRCDWDDVTGACFLAHDPHPDFAAAIAPCRDMLFTAVAAACWHREPVLDSISPCGGIACRLFKAGDGADSQGSRGLPEDRCMPQFGPAARLTPEDTYALLKRYFGSAKLSPEELANATLASQEMALAAGQEAAAHAAPGLPLVVGYGNCSTAVLHHAMRTTCRQWDEGPCVQDSRCSWMTGVGHSAHCVLSKDTVIEVLLGTGDFTRAVRSVEAACTRGSASRNACMDVVATTTA